MALTMTGADPFATPADVEARLLRPLSTVETTAAEVFLDQLSAMVRLRHGDIEDRMLSSADLGAVVRGVVAGAVVRVLRNPDGKVQESIDDYAYRRADAVAEGILYLTESEWAPLAPPAVLATAYTVSLGG